MNTCLTSVPSSSLGRNVRQAQAWHTRSWSFAHVWSQAGAWDQVKTLFMLLLLGVVALADEPSPAKQLYKALGAPSNPKVAAQWNRYHDYAEAAKLMQDLAKAYPDYCHLQSLGKTYGKRDMLVMTITN